MSISLFSVLLDQRDLALSQGTLTCMSLCTWISVSFIHTSIFGPVVASSQSVSLLQSSIPVIKSNSSLPAHFLDRDWHVWLPLGIFLNLEEVFELSLLFFQSRSLSKTGLKTGRQALSTPRITSRHNRNSIAPNSAVILLVQVSRSR